MSTYSVGTGNFVLLQPVQNCTFGFRGFHCLVYRNGTMKFLRAAEQHVTQKLNVHNPNLLQAIVLENNITFHWCRRPQMLNISQ